MRTRKRHLGAGSLDKKGEVPYNFIICKTQDTTREMKNSTWAVSFLVLEKPPVCEAGAVYVTERREVLI